MNRQIRTLISAVISVACAAPLFAQGSPSSTDAASHDLGGSIAVPIDPAGFDPQKYEIPELAGSLPGTGTHLTDGALPKVIADYELITATLRQRVTLFDGGLVAIHMTGVGGTIRKRVVIPDDALKVYRDALSADTLASVPENLSSLSQNVDRGMLRIYRADGTFAQRNFPLSLILPTEVESLRTIMNDLLRVIAEDRLVTNPMTSYKPLVGDRLLGDDKKTWKVLRVANEGEFIEVQCLQEPVKMYVAVKDLHNYFISSLGRPGAE